MKIQEIYNNRSSGNLEILFEQTTNDKSSIFRLLGFNNIDTTAKNTHISDNVSDISIHFVDLVVNEIPYIACKKILLVNQLLIEYQLIQAQIH